MTFSAKWNGRCAEPECYYGDGEIRPGDECTYVNDEVVHRECAAGLRAEPGRVAVRNGEPISMSEFTLGPRECLCPDCFTVHAGECL